MRTARLAAGRWRQGAGLEFRILGQLEVSRGGQPVAIGAARKRQVVLAVLLARSGRLVPLDTLVAAVWPDGPPSSARRNLQLYVHQLRRILGDERVASGADGYAIDTGADLDTVRFHELAVAGGASLDTGDAVAAESTLRSALDLWRGQAFADFLDCEVVATEAARLELLRLETYERWAEARLMTGATPRMAAELADLCRLHPYREGLRALLMRALYQIGRRVEALDVFRETRTLLVDELGVEPGAGLRQLHGAMLRDDETLFSAPRSGEVAADQSKVVPRQLPASPQVFTGRIDEVGALDRAHDESTMVIGAIDGMAGIGKTALAIHAAHRMADRYPDGQLFIDLHGYTQGVTPVEPADALDRMLRALGVAGTQIPAGIDERAALYRTRLAGKRMLIVLDNAATETQVAPLLPGTPGSFALVTSRRRLPGLDHTHALSLDSLPAPDAVTLLVQTAGAGRLAGQPPELMTELVELCGRLPLAIRIAAARLRSHATWSLSYLVDRLRDQRRRLVELEAGQRSITAALDLSYQDLSPDQQRTYRLLGTHPGRDIDTYATAALLDSGLRQAARLLDQLIDAHLLLEPVTGRYGFHDLTRAHAAHTAMVGQTEPAGGVPLGRLRDYYRHTASRAMDAAYPYEREHRPRVPPARSPTPDVSDPGTALAWLDTELPNLLAAARYAKDRGDVAHVLDLSRILHRHLGTRGRYDDAETLHHDALDIARETGDRTGQQDALVSLGHTNRLQDRIDLATDRFGEALRLARATGHDERAALTGLGYVYLRQGRYAKAIDYLERAMRLACAAGDRPVELHALTGLGWVHVQQGEYVQAVDHVERALRLARATGNQPVEVQALGNLSQLYLAQGRRTEAADHLTQALRLARATGHRDGELAALAGLGDIQRVQGRHRSAAGHYRELLERAQESGDRNFEFEARQGLGRLRHATGRPAAAIAYHDQALALARELDQPSDQARAHDGLGHAYRALHQHGQARMHWQRALDILARLGAERTEDDETTVEAIRVHLAGLDRPHSVRGKEQAVGQ